MRQTADPGLALVKQDARDVGSALRVSPSRGSFSTTEGMNGVRTISIPNDKGGVTRITIERDGQMRVSIESPGVPTGERVIFPGLAPRNVGRDIPPNVMELFKVASLLFVITMIGLPLVRALVRRIDRRSMQPVTPSDVSQQLTSIEQSIESVAIEVERISEGQRFTTKVLTDRTQPKPEYGPRGSAVPTERSRGV